MANSVPAPSLKFEHWVDQDYFGASGVGAQFGVSMGQAGGPLPTDFRGSPNSLRSWSGAVLQIRPSVLVGS
jgi:hypothetical protein